jgi:HAD superfamily hydrolase (TIGR01509 family)
MKQIWNEIFQELPQSVHLLRTLPAIYPMYTISNTNPWHASYLESRFDWMHLFARRFYSCTLGVRKPDPRIYELSCGLAGITPNRALFIDDRMENIIGARDFGMLTVHAPTPQVLAAELAVLLTDVQIPPTTDSFKIQV